MLAWGTDECYTADVTSLKWGLKEGVHKGSAYTTKSYTDTRCSYLLSKLK